MAMFNQKNKVTRADYEQWRAGQDETAGRIASDPDRLLFHVEPELGWLNDPNGLVQIGDTYHIYHQYDPFDAAHGGPVLWNHLTTKDFVTYENHGSVLFPDSDLDSNGAYSGSAFVRDGKIHYFYTGNVKHFDRDDYDYVLTGREQNQIHMVAENPDELGEKRMAVGPVDYPDDIGTHVRDPKILEHDGIYYMVLGARTKDDRGCVLVYTSRDLEDWNYATRIELGEKFGFMWECPDLFELDGELILVCCPQGVPADGWRYRNPHQCVWFSIEADWEAPSFKIVHFQRIGLTDGVLHHRDHPGQCQHRQDVHSHARQGAHIAPHAADQIMHAVLYGCAKALFLPDAARMYQQRTHAPEEQHDGPEQVAHHLGRTGERHGHDGVQQAAHPE